MPMQLGVLTFLGLVSSISAQSQEILLSLIWSAILLVIFVLSAAEQRVFYISLGWGLLLTTCGWMGWHGLSLVSLLSIFSLRLSASNGISAGARAMMPLFLFGCGTLLGEVVVGLGLLDGHRSFFGLGWELPRYMWRDSFRAFLDVWASSWQWVFRVALFSLSLIYFRSSAVCRRGFTKGNWYGALIASAYIVTQWLDLHSLVLSNQTELWTSLRRWCGLSSDPNAQGILFGLALWIGVFVDQSASKDVSKVPKLTLLSAGLIFLGGILTGSRTFFLILGCMGITRLFRGSIRSLVVLIFSVCSISLSITALDYYELLDPFLDKLALLPEGLVRLIRSGSMIGIPQTLESRLIFIEIAVGVISDTWLFGVGPGRFINYVSLYGRSIPSLGAWVDNANNFYLGMLAECGFFGLFAMFFAVFSHGLALHNSRWFSRTNLTMLGIILLIGPHTDFIEVLVVVALLTAVSTREKETPRFLSQSVCLVCLGASICSVLFREMGVYRWEYDDKGFTSRWLSPYARIIVPCKGQSDEGRIGELVLRASYVPSTESIRTYISSRHFPNFLTSFDDNNPKKIVLACPAGFESLSLRMSSAPAWRPYRAWPNKTNDARVLSIQQLKKNESD